MKRYDITLFVKSTIEDLKEWLGKQELSIVFGEQGFLFPELRDPASDYLKSWVEDGVNAIHLRAEGPNTIDCSNLKTELNKMLKTRGSGNAYVVRIEIDDADDKRYFTDPKE